MVTWFYCLPWWLILLVMPFITAVYGILSLFSFMKKQPIRTTIKLLFAVWIFFIIWATMIHREVGDYGEFQPLFESYRAALEQPERYRSNFMNIILFFPAGMLLFNILPWKNDIMKFITAVIAPGLLSVVIECTQYYFSVGTAEMDDIMHNTLGAFLGAGAAWFAPLAAHAVMTKFKIWRPSYDQTK